MNFDPTLTISIHPHTRLKYWRLSKESLLPQLSSFSVKTATSKSREFPYFFAHSEYCSEFVVSVFIIGLLFYSLGTNNPPKIILQENRSFSSGRQFDLVRIDFIGK